ncbi:2,3-bisphosphoglycerate-independent phosphoglycerate mutase [Moraxella osloensis]|uniref:2,3-bisphosphoglycerate-independent phosphoglycerate mutase n=1 Tax=Faucicola osloensis TaxID=34062 RepID=A0A2I1RLH2_FAUOS|nr:2,3-bisphosphoglycerate-independent phosphoglycerate mutase [Moraxella osloensis]PKZ69977.1 2,3-bisphosphoglycerate-independent phosphoglycerate mutase [Moraxella osloensis]
MNQASNSVTHQSTVKKTPHVLMILDGFGHREDQRDNAIAAAHTPNLDYLYQHYPHGLISGSGEDVGLPAGQFGNSEVGHMNLGAGRILYQDSTRIHKEIREQQFFSNPALTEAVKLANNRQANVHIMGLLSDGGVHSHQDHIVAMVELALQQGAKQVFIHTFLDGRDTPPKSADNYVAQLQQALATLNEKYEGTAYLVSLIGRYFAMDRDKRWDRVQQAYDLLTQAKAERVVQSGTEAISAAYGAGESDEFVKPTWVRYANQNADFGTIQDNDSVIFMNFRADRAREISQALVSADFDGFTREKLPTLSKFVMLTKYSDELQNNGVTSIAFEPTSLTNTLGEYLQSQGKTQLRIAETEKYAHVTFFFSGGREAEFEGEQRILVNSPAVATYDLQPEMSAPEVTEKLTHAINSGAYDVLIVNYANGDMVGHTGVFDAAVKAVETLDNCVKTIADCVIANHGHLLITADHGNVEQMQDYDSGQVHTQHTTELVPFIYVNEQAPDNVHIRTGGKLSDVAPTLLDLMHLAKPAEMTGESLIVAN